jgi:hypothetical protein
LCPPAKHQELAEQKDELMGKVAALKTDLQDWRTKLEQQVKSYKAVRVSTRTRRRCRMCWLCLCGGAGLRCVAPACHASALPQTHTRAHTCKPMQEIGQLRQALSSEVDELRGEFADLKAALKQQIAAISAVQQDEPGSADAAGGAPPTGLHGANNAAAAQLEAAFV